MCDSLPFLRSVLAKQTQYDLVMLSAVWMHLNDSERTDGMAALSALTKQSSKVILSLRHGPIPPKRRMYNVTGEETCQLAERHGFSTLLCETVASQQPQNIAKGVRWTQIVLHKE